MTHSTRRAHARARSGQGTRRRGGTVLAIMLGGALTLAAQAPATPHLADGSVDLNGIWGAAPLPPAKNPNESVKFVLRIPGVPVDSPDVLLGLDKMQVQARAAASNKPQYKADQLEKVKYLSDRQGLLDPAFHCKPQGVPRMGAPSQVVQTPGQIVFLYEASNLFRVIPTDGRPHRADADPSYMGDSTGRFDGDTLVVDVTNFIDDTWLGSDGYFHTDKMHVVERLTRKGDTLTYSATVEDPEVLATPWVTTPRDLRLSASRATALLEAPPCVEKDSSHVVTLDHH